MQATQITFEKRYSDDSGVEFGVRLNGDEIELESLNTIVMPAREIYWLIAALERVREEIERGKTPND